MLLRLIFVVVNFTPLFGGKFEFCPLKTVTSFVVRFITNLICFDNIG